MANFQITPSPVTVENKEYKFSNLYLLNDGKNQAEVTRDDAIGLGKMTVNNWEIRDGVGSGAAIVARAQGLHIHAGNWSSVFSIVFETPSGFKGSTLEVMGTPVDSVELAIVGGTGQFAMARGVICKRDHPGQSSIQLITIRGFFPKLTEVQPPPPPPPVVNYTRPVMIGTCGGNGGKAFDVYQGDTPTRLKKMTIHSYGVIDAIDFTYINQSGQECTVRAGGTSSNAVPHPIELRPDEFVKEIKGLVGGINSSTVIRTLAIVTNMTTYGPYGNDKYRVIEPFRIPVAENSRIVGFFGRAEQFVDAIGVYVKEE